MLNEAVDRDALRREFRARRRTFVGGLDDGAPDGVVRNALETSLAAHLVPLLAGADSPASYVARGGEIDPRWIEADWLSADRGALAFPRVAGKRIIFHRATLELLAPGYYDIPEPDCAAPIANPDLVLVPLLACTLKGVRLGQGGGFYDRALAAMRASGRIIAVGLAWEVQVVDHLPEAEWDARLDYVATPARLVDCRAHG